MRSSKRKGWIIGAGAFALLALGAGCTGFFVNQPNSVAVTTGPSGTGTSTFTVAQGATVKLFATASFNSGSKDVTNSATWASSTPCATVSAGNVKGVGTASDVTISATVGGVGGSATGSVTGGSGQALTISPQGSFSIAANPTGVQFTATDSNNNDVTNSATWTSGNTSFLTFSSTPGLATLVASGTTTVTASITSGGTCSSGSETVTITP